MKRLTAWAKKENIGLAKAQPSKKGFRYLFINGKKFATVIKTISTIA
jgi:hypothetical protein